MSLVKMSVPPDSVFSSVWKKVFEMRSLSIGRQSISTLNLVVSAIPGNVPLGGTKFRVVPVLKFALNDKVFSVVLVKPRLKSSYL